MATVRLNLEQLDAKMAQFQQMYEPQEYDVEPIEMDFDVFPSVVSDDLPFSPDARPAAPEEPTGEPLPAAPEEPEPVLSAPAQPEPVAVQPEPEEPESELPDPVQPELVLSGSEHVQPAPEEPEPVATVRPEPESAAAAVAVIDAMATRHAWKNDMPGSQVKDVRAAIALVDRALFINTLFNEDAMAFLEALNYINQAGDLDTVVNYLAETYPQWDFDSDVVYRFMMAVRRKVN